MNVYRWDEIEKEHLSPLFARQVIHSETMTVAKVYLAQGCSVPEHSHMNEQLSTIEQGHLKFIIDGEEVILNPGETLRIPPDVRHSAEALDDVVALDLFSPPREDWIRGEDAYLRK